MRQYQKTAGRFLAAAIALIGIVVAQLHGMPFWQSLMGGAVGACISLFWEMSSLWAWVFAPRTTLNASVKYGATAMLIFGMIGHTVGPFLSAKADVEALTAQRGVKEKIVDTVANVVLEQSKRAEKQQDNNWAGLAQQTGKQQQANVDKLLSIASTPVQMTKPLTWFDSLSKMILPLVIYPYLYMMTLAALIALREEEEQTMQGVEPPAKEGGVQDAPSFVSSTIDEDRVLIICGPQLFALGCVIQEHLKRVCVGTTQDAIALNYGTVKSRVNAWYNFKKVVAEKGSSPKRSSFIKAAMQFQVPEIAITEALGTDTWKGEIADAI